MKSFVCAALARNLGRIAVTAALALLGGGACSGDGNARGRDPGEVGVFDGGPAGTAARSGSGGAGAAGVIGVAGAGDALTVEVQDRARMTIEIVTLKCAGDCADVEAVARGGNPPYAFEWDDGSSNTKRSLCADTSTTFVVTVSDTAIKDPEFHYDAQTVSTEVSATVLDCSDAGAAADSCKSGIEPGVYEGTFKQSSGVLSGTHTITVAAAGAVGSVEAISGTLHNTLSGSNVTSMLMWLDGSSYDCATQRLFLSGIQPGQTALTIPYTYVATYDATTHTLVGDWASAAPPSPGQFPTNAIDEGTWDAHWISR